MTSHSKYQMVSKSENNQTIKYSNAFQKSSNGKHHADMYILYSIHMKITMGFYNEIYLQNCFLKQE